MNLSQICIRARSLAGIRSAALLPDEEIIEAVNEFNYNLMTAYDWPQLVGSSVLTCVSGSDTVAYPSAVAVVLSLHNEDDAVATNEMLRGISQTEMDLLGKKSAGRPSVFVADAMERVVTFSPTPDAAYKLRLRFKRRITPLLLSGDAPLFDEEFHLMFAQAAASAILRAHGGDPARIQNLDVRVQASLGRARKRYLMNPDRTALPLPSRWF